MWNINAKIKRYDYGFHCSASQSGKTFSIFGHGCAGQGMVITRYIQYKTKRIESTEYENVCGGVYLFIGCSNELSDSIAGTTDNGQGKFVCVNGVLQF